MATAQIALDVPELLHPTTRRQYDHLIEVGHFGPDDRVELLEGFLVTMSPHGPPHAYVVAFLTELLVRTLPGHLRVRCQSPIAATADSQPEPDLAVVARTSDDRQAHPTTALLVIEVSKTSLRIDLGPKARVYAAAEVAEYWVIDVVARVVHRHLGPTAAGYESVTEHSGGRLRSTSVPEVEVDLDDLLMA